MHALKNEKNKAEGLQEQNGLFLFFILHQLI